MITFFKKLFCNCEVDMENLEEPICKKCNCEISKVLTNRHGIESNPKLDKWFIARNLPKYASLFKGLKK